MFKTAPEDICMLHTGRGPKRQGMKLGSIDRQVDFLEQWITKYIK